MMVGRDGGTHSGAPSASVPSRRRGCSSVAASVDRRPPGSSMAVATVRPLGVISYMCVRSYCLTGGARRRRPRLLRGVFGISCLLDLAIVVAVGVGGVRMLDAPDQHANGRQR